MALSTDQLRQAEEDLNLIREARDAMDRLNDAAAKLTSRGYTVRVNGWTSPGTIGNVRVRGNTGLTIDERQQ